MKKHFIYITNLMISDLNSQKIRAVDALWIDKRNTACLSFYFDGEITEKEREDAEIACVEIIAHCGNGLLEEHFIRWDYPKPLPNKFFAYKKESM